MLLAIEQHCQRFFYVHMKALLFKTLVFTHRYIGIVIGWLMLVWCLSGLVMVYVSYPELRTEQRQAMLASLDVQGCCQIPQDLFAIDERIAAVSVEMLVNTPVLRIEPAIGPIEYVDLRSGAQMPELDATAAQAVALQYQSTASVTQPVLEGLIERDQWTVYSRYNKQRPLYKLALHDAAGTEIYVSSVDGQAVQLTTRMQRFWNWLGAVPHWLYFTALRQHVELWSQVVIWSSLVGCFLTLFGLFLGVWQLRRKSDNKLHSPYRGWKYWHHVPGLLFGVLVLTWVLSGLLSMTPWGVLESAGKAEPARQLRGELPTWQTVHESLQQLQAATLPINTVHIESSVLQGQLYYLIDTRAGVRTRHDARWQVAQLLEATQQQLAELLVPASRPELLSHEDEYWYRVGNDTAVLPVIRVQSTTGTRYYLDAISGELLQKLDDNARWYRWLHSGLHRMDFAAVTRARPVRDALMWLLLGGAVMVCATGFWLGVRRLRGR